MGDVPADVSTAGDASPRPPAFDAHAEPKSESESISPMNNRFRSPMIQSGLFAPSTFGRCSIYSHGRFYSYVGCQKSHLFRFLTFLGVGWGASWTPSYGIKTESIPEPKVRSRNQPFLDGNALLGSESESAPVFFGGGSGTVIDSSQLESSTSLLLTDVPLYRCTPTYIQFQ